MNKFIYLILIICIFCECSAQNKEFEKFRNEYQVVPLPYNTSGLNNPDTYISLSKKKVLSSEFCLNYLVNNDKTKLEYSYEKYDMETGESKGVVKDKYKFYPAFRFENDKMVILITLRTSINTYSYLLSIVNLKNLRSDFIEINKMDAEDEYKLVQCGFIDNQLSINVFRYEINPEYLKDIRKKDIDKSIITTQIFKIDSKEKFLLVKEERFKSKCAVAEFYGKAKKCHEQDPMKNLQNP